MTYLAYFIYVIYIFLSSPFLFVYGDDRVIRYTGADVDIGDVEDTQATEWGLAWEIRARRFSLYFVMFQLWLRIFETCNTFIIYVL